MKKKYIYLKYKYYGINKVVQPYRQEDQQIRKQFRTKKSELHQKGTKTRKNLL